MTLCTPACAAPLSRSVLEWGLYLGAHQGQDETISYPLFSPKPLDDGPLSFEVEDSLYYQRTLRDTVLLACDLSNAFFFFLNLFIWLCQVLVVAGGLLSCGM